MRTGLLRYKRRGRARSRHRWVDQGQARHAVWVLRTLCFISIPTAEGAPNEADLAPDPNHSQCTQGGDR
jgi:hypothetical protein